MQIGWWQKRKLRKRGVTIWQPCNIYQTVSFGRNISVGMFSEIGNNVTIGDDTRIGMGCFIPEGIEIGKGCFIGPRVCFVHDKLLWDTFPVGNMHWQKTYVEDGAVIGANVLICPGIRIGKGALVGIGSVVTKDIGEDEVWFGNPAHYIRRRNENG